MDLIYLNLIIYNYSLFKYHKRMNKIKELNDELENM